VVGALRQSGSNTTGRLHAELCPDGGLSRDDFEEVLGAMARAGVARLTDAVFEKDGKSIPYRKVSLTPAAAEIDTEGTLDLRIKAAMPKPQRTRKKKGAKAAKAKRTRKPAAPPEQAPVPRAAAPPPRDFESWRSAKSESAGDLEATLKEWRLKEARRLNIPAFRIFSDQVLRALAARRPATAAELLSIPGVGISTVEKYGAQLYRMLHAGRA
jgi:superfamily II DNA helicase RecQ